MKVELRRPASSIRGGGGGGAEGIESNVGGCKQRQEGNERGVAVMVEFLPLDLSSFQSTLECVRIFKEKALPLHILINNAGIAFTPYSE